MTNNIILGQNEYGEIYFAEIKDGKIRGFNGYYYISPEISYDNNCYLDNCSWMHSVTINGVEYKSGTVLAENITPFFLDEEVKTIILEEKYYNAEGSYCSECGTFHDTEQYYDLSYVITEDCDLLCKTCANAEDLLVKLDHSTSIFNSKDITGMNFATDEFEEVETLFCDSTGFGSPYESAMTEEQAISRANELIDQYGTLYAGLTGIGQFQVYVTLYTRKSQAKTA